MAYILKFQVVGDQDAINKTKRVYNEGEKNATSSAGKIKDRFRDVFENVTQNATGAFGSVAGGLFKLPGAAGVAAAGVLAAFGGMIAAANKYAQANATTDAASAQFLGTIERLKSSFSSTVNVVGSVAVTVFNRLAEVFGIAGTKADELRAKYNATISNLKTRKDEINEIVAALRLREESTGALRPLLEAADKLKALENERNKVLVSIESTEKNIATARGEAYKQQGLAYLLDKKTRDEFDKKLAAQNLSLVQLQAQLENLNQQVTAAEQLLLSEQKRYENTNKVEQTQKAIVSNQTTELEVNQKVSSLILNQLEVKQKQLLLLPILANLQLTIAGALAQQASNSKHVNALTAEQLTLQQQIGNQINSQIANGLAAGLVYGEKLNIVLGNILRQLANRVLTNLIFKGLSALFPGAGLAGGILGGLLGVGKGNGGTSSRISTNFPIAVPSSSVGGNSAVLNMNVAFSGNNMNQEQIIRALNKFVKQGGRLLASQLKD